MEGRGDDREGGHELTLFWADLDAPPLPPEALEAALDAGDRERARRFAQPLHGRRWVAARGLLRHLLGLRLGVDPVRVGLQQTERGKPYLPDGPSFNLSHSGPHLLVGLAPRGRLGVDVERARPLKDLDALVRRFFHPDEAEAILALSGGEDGGPRARAFFRTWARKEAFVKALGVGIGAPLDAFRVAVGEDQPASDRVRPGGSLTGRSLLLQVELAGESPVPWRILDVPSPSGVAAAVAWDAAELIPRVRLWPDPPLQGGPGIA